MSLDDLLRQLAATPTMPVDLAELALALASDEYPDLDLADYRSRIDRLAEQVAQRMAPATDLTARVTALTDVLFDQEGFIGNDDEYYDPRNSYFNEVLDRRLGIPITLSVLAIAVAERCSLQVSGVGLPGHFVVKATNDDDAEVIFDPFNGGRILDRTGCRHLVESITGHPFSINDSALAPTPPGLIAVRILTNLKGIYLRASDFHRAARTTERLIQLMPGDLTQRRDLGVTLYHADRPGAAIDHLRAYLAVQPDADDAAAVAEFLKRARREVARWN